MHLDFLYQRVESFVDDGGPYKLHTQPDSKTGEITVYGQVLGEPPIDEWGAIIGDVVHNLRSALDHLVWQLTIAEGHTPPPNPIPKRGLGSEWRDIGFPIYVKPHPTDYLGNLIPWTGAKDLQSLWGIGPRLRAEFQGLQPFVTGQNPTKEPLAILDELWNIDRHRHLHPTLFYVGLHDVESKSPKLKFRILEKKSPGPFKGRAEIGRVEAVGGPYPNSLMVQMNVQPILTFDIAFEQGPPAYGAPVIETLSEVRHDIADILRLFDALSRVPVP
jgi:hypothetical protein